MRLLLKGVKYPFLAMWGNLHQLLVEKLQVLCFPLSQHYMHVGILQWIQYCSSLWLKGTMFDLQTASGTHCLGLLVFQGLILLFLLGLDLEREGAQPFNFEGIDGISEFLGWVYKHSHGPVSWSNLYVLWMLALPLKRSSFGWDRLEQFFCKFVVILPIYCDTWMINIM